jgi:hypothetical protein
VPAALSLGRDLPGWPAGGPRCGRGFAAGGEQAPG